MNTIRAFTLIFVALGCALNSEAPVLHLIKTPQGSNLPIGLMSNEVKGESFIRLLKESQSYEVPELFNEVQITAVKPFRLGDTIRVSCSVPSEIAKCFWEVHGIQQSRPVRIFLPAPGKGTSECVFEAKATEDMNGFLVCKVFTESDGWVIVEQAGTNISIISLPSVSLRPSTARTTIPASEEKQVVCVVNDARPIPTLTWKIGDIEVDSKDYEVITQVDQNGKATMNSILKRRFIPEENNKTLQCIAEADWLRQEDNAAAQTTLDIQFPPMPQSIITVNDFEENKPDGQVQVTVHANPHPHSASWTMPTPFNDTFEVEGEPVDDEPVVNYVGRPGEDNGNDTYTYRLSTSSIHQQDQTTNSPAGADDLQDKEQSDNSSSYSWIIVAVFLVIFFFIVCFIIFKKYSSNLPGLVFFL